MSNRAQRFPDRLALPNLPAPEADVRRRKRRGIVCADDFEANRSRQQEPVERLLDNPKAETMFDIVLCGLCGHRTTRTQRAETCESCGAILLWLYCRSEWFCCIIHAVCGHRWRYLCTANSYSRE